MAERTDADRWDECALWLEELLWACPPDGVRIDVTHAGGEVALAAPGTAWRLRMPAAFAFRVALVLRGCAGVVPRFADELTREAAAAEGEAARA